jgi:hypothetical protein
VPEPVLPVMDEAEPLPMDASADGMSHPLDITEVWEVEAGVPVAVTSQSDVPTDREQRRAADERTGEPEAERASSKRKAASGVMWVEAEVDHDAVPSAPTVPASPSQPAGVPVPVPVAASGSVRVGPERGVTKGPLAAVLAAMLWIGVGGGLLWAVWPSGAEREGKREEVVAVVPAQEGTVPAAQEAMEPMGPEVGPAVEVEPEPVRAPEPLEVTEPVQTTEPVEAPEPEHGIEPGPEAVETTEPAQATEPSPTTEPETPAEPTPAPTAEPKPTSKPVRKKASKPRLPLPPSRITIALRVGAPMDIELDGVHRSLTVSAPLVKVAIVPGRVRVRWRRPTGDWKSRKVEIEPGVDYTVALEPSGPTFTPQPRKAP